MTAISWFRSAPLPTAFPPTGLSGGQSHAPDISTWTRPELGIPPGRSNATSGWTYRHLRTYRIIRATLSPPARPGCSVVYCNDTVFCEAAVSWPKAPIPAHPRVHLCHCGRKWLFSASTPTSTVARPDAALAGVKQLVAHPSQPALRGRQCLHPEDLLEEAPRHLCQHLGWLRIFSLWT